MWIAEHSAYIVLFLVVVVASGLWCRLLMLQTIAEEERDEEMARRMVEMCETYNYRDDTFR